MNSFPVEEVKRNITFRLFFFNVHELQYIFRVVARNIEPLDFAF